MENITCTICKATQPSANFGPRNNGKYTKHQCKECLRKEGQIHYIDNHDKELQRRNAYRQQHQDQIKEIHTCKCGGTYQLKGKARHEISNKHQQYINGTATNKQTNKHKVNYYTYGENYTNKKPAVIVLTDKQYADFLQLKASINPHYSARKTLQLWQLI